jgi:hypothetical protein
MVVTKSAGRIVGEYAPWVGASCAAEVVDVCEPPLVVELATDEVVLLEPDDPQPPINASATSGRAGFAIPPAREPRLPLSFIPCSIRLGGLP